jgi:hypothetical protein
MTAQVSDSVNATGKEYILAGINGAGLFDPTEHGMNPLGFCTACWRGFVCLYAVNEAGNLELQTLHIGLAADKIVPFRGISPTSDGIFGMTRYENLGLPIAYTGSLLLADGFIQSLYVHMGFHLAWKYREVQELFFEKGRLTETRDRSAEMAEIREKSTSQPLAPPGRNENAIRDWVERCFRREYKPLP